MRQHSRSRITLVLLNQVFTSMPSTCQTDLWGVCIHKHLPCPMGQWPGTERSASVDRPAVLQGGVLHQRTRLLGQSRRFYQTHDRTV
ncbi:hypothetical protein EV702DRAFT_1071677 [Suillus placidus]|uniref:Secreted protein n=1 Tax=Suillus placidus TaxID=48579 RepID=A0A9P7D5Z6_9AGAM|nr:hypothetical protein EV702DRAFT_1071677 [Suillus placidus]